MNDLNILVAESKSFAPEAAQLLSALGRTRFADLDRTRLLQEIPDADMLWVRLRHRIDSKVLDAANRLRVIATPTTGLNHIDLDQTERRGIRVLSLKGEVSFLENVRATAEHTICLMLSLLRHVPYAFEHVCSGRWSRDLFVGTELYAKTAGIIGYGRLGRIVARYLTAFGVTVLVCDCPEKPLDLPEGVESVDLDTLLAASDLVSLHVELNPTSSNFFGRREFERMKPGAVFINTARGELVDEAALLDALRSQRLLGAALDVLSGEDSQGMNTHPLLGYAREHENLLITPHIGGCTTESMAATELFLARKCAELWSTTPE